MSKTNPSKALRDALVWRTAATDKVVVSTVLVHDGGARFYETALVVNGKVSDGRRNAKKFDAGYEHDNAVAFARGYAHDLKSNSKRDEFWSAQLKQVQS